MAFKLFHFSFLWYLSSCLFVSVCLSIRCLPGYPYKCPKLQIIPEQGLTKTDADNLLRLLLDQVWDNLLFICLLFCWLFWCVNDFQVIKIYIFELNLLNLVLPPIFVGYNFFFFFWIGNLQCSRRASNDFQSGGGCSRVLVWNHSNWPANKSCKLSCSTFISICLCTNLLQYLCKFDFQFICLAINYSLFVINGCFFSQLYFDWICTTFLLFEVYGSIYIFLLILVPPIFIFFIIIIFHFLV